MDMMYYEVVLPGTESSYKQAANELRDLGNTVELYNIKIERRLNSILGDFDRYSVVSFYTRKADSVIVDLSLTNGVRLRMETSII